AIVGVDAADAISFALQQTDHLIGMPLDADRAPDGVQRAEQVPGQRGPDQADPGIAVHVLAGEVAATLQPIAQDARVSLFRADDAGARVVKVAARLAPRLGDHGHRAHARQRAQRVRVLQADARRAFAGAQLCLPHDPDRVLAELAHLLAEA